MNQYIDSEKLIELVKEWRSKQMGFAWDAVNEVLKLISALQQEQPEVDLEKEYSEFVEQDMVYSRLVNGIVGKAIARHFYELGLNARKEGTK